MSIYLDDLEQLFNVLRSENTESISIETKDKIFDPSEIDQLESQVVSFLEINAKFPQYEMVSIKFSDSGVWIYCSSNTTQTQGITRQLESLLKNNRRLASFVHSWLYINTLLLILVPASIVLTVSSFLDWNFLSPTVVSAVNLSYILVFLYDRFYKNVIHFNRRDKHVSFFRRNKDNLLVQIIGGAIIAFIAFILGKYF